jgi:subfamily B ATP-binding cassette protein MsbA
MLITGIVRPTSGRIRIGGVSYEDINQWELRSAMGYVTQESVAFRDSLRNNITLFDGSAPDARVRDAVARAHLTAFVNALPNGLETELSDAGLNISGGQRQRVNIARELFKDAQLLIFDEATSALDSESEQEVQNNIDEFHGEKTIVVIAHRLSTVKRSDRILFISDGRLMEQGTYQELYLRGGAFRRMVDQQALDTGSWHAAAGQ